MAIDPAKEQEMVRYFQTVFRPAAMKFRGYVDVRMLKVLAVPVGTPRPRASITVFPSRTKAKSCGRSGWRRTSTRRSGATWRRVSAPDYTVILFEVI